MIKKISIEDYKSIKMMELELRDINVLIRANGSDKSNFISYFLLIHNLYEQRLCNYTMQNNAEDLVYFGVKHTQEICSVINCEESQYSFVLQPRVNGSMFVTEEQYKDLNGTIIFNHRDEEESILADLGLTPNYRYIVIEEPEMGLHPNAMQTVLLQVIALMNAGYKVIISTHSSVLLDFAWANTFLKQIPGNKYSEAMKELFEDDQDRLYTGLKTKDIKTFYFSRNEKNKRHQYG